MTPAGQLTTLISMMPTGAIPTAPWWFYGTTSSGGPGRGGTVFKLTPAGKLTTLTSFSGTNDRHPAAWLILGSDGNFYGTTREGGTTGNGESVWQRGTAIPNVLASDALFEVVSVPYPTTAGGFPGLFARLRVTLLP